MKTFIYVAIFVFTAIYLINFGAQIATFAAAEYSTYTRCIKENIATGVERKDIDTRGLCDHVKPEAMKGDK